MNPKSEARTRALSSTEVAPFLPFVYTVWADGELTDDELGAFLGHFGGLSSQALEEISAWLSPAEPPSAFELATLLSSLQQRLPTDEELPPTLANIGMALKSVTGSDNPENQTTRKVLETLQGQLVNKNVAGELARKTSPRPAPPKVTGDGSVLNIIALQNWLDGDYKPVRDEVREFLKVASPMPTFHLEIPEQRQHILERLKILAETELPKLAYQGATTEENLGRFLAAFEVLAHGDLSLWVKAGVQFGLFGGAIHALGTERHHKYLPEIAAAKLLGGFAMTERNHGSNVAGLETTAVYDHQTRSITINTPHDGARKEYIGNAALHGTMAVVFAQLSVKGTPVGVHAVLVPIRNEDRSEAKGVRIGDCGPKMGLDGVDNGRLWFDNATVPVENLLDRFGSIDEEGNYLSPIASPTKRFFRMLSTLVRGRVSVASAALSAAKTGLAIAIPYSDSRRQFGPRGTEEQQILDYPSQQKRLLPRLAQAYAIHFAVADLQKVCAETPDSKTLEAQAAGLKAYISRYATDTLQACREASGGAAYLASSRLPALRMDTDIFTTFEGDNTVLWQLVAKHLLSDFSSQFSDSKFVGMAKYLANRAVAKIQAQNPKTARQTDIDHLLDPATTEEALRFRAEELLHTLAKRMQHRLKQDIDPFIAFAEIQNHAIAAARAQIEHSVLLSFDTAITSLETQPEQEKNVPTIKKLRALFALERVRADSDWFLENQYFEASKSKAIRKAVAALLLEIREHAADLAAAFAIPDSCLGPADSLLRQSRDEVNG